MPKVIFNDDFDYSPVQYNGRVTMAYKAGTMHNVKQECADQAIGSGKAELIGNKGKDNAENPISK